MNIENGKDDEYSVIDREIILILLGLIKLFSRDFY